MRLIMILVAAALVGCNTLTKETFMEWAEQHDNALNNATNKLDQADSKLGEIENPPPQVPEARKNITEAKGQIGIAKDVSDKIVDGAIAENTRRVEVEKSFWSTRQKNLAIGIGATLALVGLIIVLLRYGSWGGTVAALPLIGAVLVKIGVVRKK